MINRAAAHDVIVDHQDNPEMEQSYIREDKSYQCKFLYLNDNFIYYLKAKKKIHIKLLKILLKFSL